MGAGLGWSWYWFFHFLFNQQLLSGALVTLWLTGATIVGGLVAGTLLGLLGTTDVPVLSWLYTMYVTIVRGTPLLVQLIFVYTALPELGLVLTVVESALLALIVNESAYMAEYVRGGINNVGQGQVESARALGMTHLQVMRFVVLPQALRSIVPAVGNEVNGVLKSTSLVSVISLQELFRATEQLIQVSFRVLELFSIAALYYIVMTTIWGLCQREIEGRLAIPPRPHQWPRAFRIVPTLRQRFRVGSQGG